MTLDVAIIPWAWHQRHMQQKHFIKILKIEICCTCCKFGPYNPPALLKCAGQCSVLDSQSCTTATSVLTLERRQRPQKGTPTHGVVPYSSVCLSPHSPLPQSWATVDFLSIFMDLPVWDIFYTWNHTICGLLSSFTQDSILKVFPCWSM